MKKILVTGEKLFLNRHKYLFTELSKYGGEWNYLTIPQLYEPRIYRRFMRLLYCLTHGVSLSNSDGFFKNSKAFIKRSERIEQHIKQLEYTPNLVFHLFSMCCPFWSNFEIPYMMYLDYTMNLAHKNYPSFAPFSNSQELQSWLKCERKAYDNCKHLFTMSHLVKNSLVKDYGIDSDKITVIGASGNFEFPYKSDKEKIFGSQQILFNGSDFQRKGGDLVLEAFKQVKQALPKAKLVVIGQNINTFIEGVENPGEVVSPDDLKNIFLKTDLVVAPARCEPFGVFLIEAMNFGVPCIVSANEANGITDFLEHEVDSIIIHQPNPQMLAVQIINLLCNTNRLKSMSKAAQIKVKNNLNWKDIAAKVSPYIT